MPNQKDELKAKLLEHAEATIEQMLFGKRLSERKTISELDLSDLRCSD